MHQIKQICLYRYVISFARFEGDICLNSYEIVAKLAKILQRCLAPCKVIQILQFRKFVFIKSCILEISSRGMRGGGRLYTGYIWNPQFCQRLESGIHHIRNPQHGIQTPNIVLYYLTWSDMFRLRAGQITVTVKII